MLRRIAIVALLMLGVLTPAPAQQNLGAIDLTTTNGSVSITTGLTYQLVLAATPLNPAPDQSRKSLTIQNNQATGSDVCYLIVGSLGGQVVAGTTTTSTNVTVGGKTITAAQASIVLIVSEAYTRYFPAIPSDAIYGTCTTTADSIYIDTQP